LNCDVTENFLKPNKQKEADLSFTDADLSAEFALLLKSQYGVTGTQAEELASELVAKARAYLTDRDTQKDLPEEGT
jgi:hypothetical protein